MQRALAGLKAGVLKVQEGPGGQAAGEVLRAAVEMTAPRRSGRLASSFTAHAVGPEIRATSEVEYAGRQNYGGGGVPATHYGDRALARATGPATAAYEKELTRLAHKVEA